MATFVCSKCGGGPATVNKARPSLDDRFAVGYCPDGCTPAPVYNSRLRRYQPAEQSVVTLVRQDAYDPTAAATRRRVDAERKLVRRNLRCDVRLTSAQRAEAVEIRQRWEAEAEARRGSGR